MDRSDYRTSPGIAIPGFSLFVILISSTFASALEPCRISIIDAENGWPVPPGNFVTNHQVRFISDNAGVIAFSDLGFELMGSKHGSPSKGMATACRLMASAIGVPPQSLVKSRL